MVGVAVELTINGEKKNLECERVLELLDILNLNKDAVAVELNKNIVYRENFEKTKLKNNDSLEIVRAVGGG